jgi:hypothetical protein
MVKQVPVSIADLGGIEIDLRFASPKQGCLFVIVAPCKRFSERESVSVLLVCLPDLMLWINPWIFLQITESLCRQIH